MANQSLLECKNCGCVERYKDGKCKSCVQARIRRYADKHRERLREYCASWRLKNIDAVREVDRVRSAKFRKEEPKRRAEIAKASALRNKETTSEAGRRWKKKNPEIVRAYALNRRAKTAGQNSRLPRGTIKKLMLSQKMQCVCCSVCLKNGYHVDHIIALASGGKHEPLNLQLLCPTCNMSKGAKDPIDFMQSRGFLL